MRKISLVVAWICIFTPLSAFEAMQKPFRFSSPMPEARYFTNEGFRAAALGSKNIARDLFYKACIMGDDVSCMALNELKVPLSVDKIIIAKQECGCGIAQSCLSLYRYYANDAVLDTYTASWFLSKACRLGSYEACKLEFAKIPAYINNERQSLTNECYYNDSLSCYKLANIYIFGRGVVRNIGFAKDLLKRSCELGQKKACTMYIEILSKQL